jgi:hypothetical protein
VAGRELPTSNRTGTLRIVNVTFRGAGGSTLQTTLSSASAGSSDGATVVRPHHPINCSTELRLEPDGTFSCNHASVPGGDERTRFCVNHSLALLLIELAHEL